MPTLTMPSVSTQPVQQQVSAIVDGAPYDFSGDQAFMSFVPQPNYGPPPEPTVWNAATIEVDAGPTYWISCLVGVANGGVVLTPGAYLIAVKVVDNPAIPILWGWSLLIT